MREIRISEVKVEQTLAKARKLAKRGQEKGLSGGYECRIEYRSEVVEGETYQYPVLVIEGEPVKYNGFEFIAIAEVKEGQVLTRSVSESASVKPSEVQVGYCAHCQTNRNRSQYLFVKNESGEIKQVGSSCVKDYLGWTFNPSYIVTEDRFEEEFGSRLGGVSGVSTSSVATIAVKVAKDDRYAYIGVKDIVRDYFFNSRMKSEIAQRIGEVTESDIAEGQALIEFAQSFEGDSSYAENLRASANLEFQDYSTIGIFVSAIRAKEKIEKVAKATAKTYQSAQFAPTGEKVEIPVKVLAKSEFETQYGWSTLWTFESGDYRFKWFDSGYTFKAQVDDEFIIKGTIKGSDEYKGAFSTMLTRVKKVEAKELVTK